MKFKTIVLIGIMSQTICSAQTQEAAKKYEFYKTLHGRLAAGQTVIDIQDSIPNLKRKLKNAIKLSHHAWTDSNLFDENAKAIILDPKILSRLGIDSIQFAPENFHVSAGVMHTYGYMFSQLQTKFGLKSKRWIESHIDERIGLAGDTFNPTTKHGEFLSNLTKALEDLISKKNQAVKAFGVLEEFVEWQVKDEKKSANIFTYFYDLLPNRDDPKKVEKLLIYQIKMNDEPSKFVTAFPVDMDFIEKIKQTKESKNTEYKGQYNWHVNPEWIVLNHETKVFKEF